MIRILLFVLIVVSKPALAQVSDIDSLINQIPKVTNDTTKARLYKSIVEQSSTHDLDLAMKYAREGLAHVEQMKWKKGIAVFNQLIGSVNSDHGDYKTAIDYMRKAYAIHVDNKDDYNAAATLNNIGTAYSRQSNFDKAAENYFAALAIADKAGNKDQQAIFLSNISVLYFDQNNLTKAQEYDKKALELHRSAGNRMGMANVMVGMANTYLVQADTAHSIQLYEEALTIYKSEGDEFGAATVLTNMSILVKPEQRNLEYKLEAQEIWDRISPAHPVSLNNLSNTGLLYLDRARNVSASSTTLLSRKETLAMAERYLHRAEILSKESNRVASYSFVMGLLSELEAEKGNYKKAYENSKIYHHLNDSIYSQDSKNKISLMEGQYEVALRDKEISLNKQALSEQRVQLIALVVGLILLAIIGALIYHQSTIRRNNNIRLSRLNLELIEANQVKSKLFAIISHDLRAPIARLINFLHLQRETPDLLSKDQVAAHQNKITAAAENLLVNMEEILLWSKGQMENFKPSMKSVPVAQLFRRLEQSFDQVNSTLSFSDTADLAIFTDENFAYTILHNLTNNAVNASRQITDSKIKWSAIKKDTHVLLTISDNGPGMKQSWGEVVSNTNNVNSGISGFGFYIVRDMANAIQCTISIEPPTGAGTTIHLSFPAEG